MAIKIHEDKLHQTRVQFDYQPEDQDLWFDAYSDDQTWNGWACPLFTKEQGMKVIEFINQQFIPRENPKHQAVYDADQDAFVVFWDDNISDGPDIHLGRDVTMNGETLHVYPIGSWMCTWVSEDYE